LVRVKRKRSTLHYRLSKGKKRGKNNCPVCRGKGKGHKLIGRSEEGWSHQKEGRKGKKPLGLPNEGKKEEVHIPNRSTHKRKKGGTKCLCYQFVGGSTRVTLNATREILQVGRNQKGGEEKKSTGSKERGTSLYSS